MKYILFDIGNVLIDFVFADFFKVHVGCSCWPDVPSCKQDILMRDAVESGRIDDKEWVDYLNKVHGLSWSYADLVEVWTKMFSLNPTGLALFRMAVESDAVVCTLSNLALHHMDAICGKWGGLFHGADELFLSYQIGERKPHSYIYRHALSALGASADDCVFLDDRKENVVAARQEGINAHWFVPENYESIILMVKRISWIDYECLDAWNRDGGAGEDLYEG